MCLPIELEIPYPNLKNESCCCRSTHNEGEDEDNDEQDEIDDARNSPFLVEHFLALSLGTKQKPATIRTC